MTTPQDNGGPAFPPHWGGEGYGGMTLRDYFAAKAVTLFTLEDKHVVALREGAQPAHDVVAKFCYGLADSMLAARNAKR
jgi:hypothetical protein